MGRTHALLLARQGAAVVVNDPGFASDGRGIDESVANGVVAEIEARGGRAVASFADVSTARGGRQLYETAVDSFGDVDVFVHNAGLNFERPFDAPFEFVEAQLNVHLAAAWHVGRPVWEGMTRVGYGRIVLVSSAAIYGMPKHGAYAAAKAGLSALARSLQFDADDAGHDIRANSVLPMARTRMTAPEEEHSWDGLNGPEEVSAVVGYLASPECKLRGEALVTGATHVARVALVQSRGWAKGAPALTIDEVATHCDEICDMDGATLAISAADYITTVRQHLFPESAT